MTPAPSYSCYDYYVNCSSLAKTSCYKATTSSKCIKSCGLCPGMTPAPSNTCYDTYKVEVRNCGKAYDNTYMNNIVRSVEFII